MSMDEGEKDENGGENEKGREKRVSGKRKKGLAFKLSTTNGESSATGSSSMETSPLPSSNLAPVSHSSWKEAQPIPQTADRHVSNPRQANIPLASIRQAEPNGNVGPPPIVISLAEPSPSRDIPLPDSPLSGSSRLDVADMDQQSVMDAEASESAVSESKSKQTKGISDGFSVFPEEGYLPAQQVSISGRKKRRKPRGGLLPQSLTSAMSISHTSNESLDHQTWSGRRQGSAESPKSFHVRNGRGTILHLSADVQELLDERDRIIGSLRAENGESKAKEGKAREEARRARINEEMVSKDMDRMRRMHQKGESEGRRRENEVSSILLSKTPTEFHPASKQTQSFK